MFAEERRLRRELAEERDRRYAEVGLEREKALKIKDEADRRALELAREIQSLKDEQANRLREQIASERGLYATHAELKSLEEKLYASLRPLLDFVAGSTGRDRGLGISWQVLVAAIVVAGAVVAMVFHR
jgi:vacuolar-type H+-ATPase subunit E/Vma4